MTISEDGNVFRFRLRPEARWHDGTPITAHDVAFTFKALKRDGHPEFSLPLAVLSEAIAEDDLTAALVFDGRQSALAILTIANVSDHLRRTGTASTAFTDAKLDQPLTSGPYTVGRFRPGSFIEYERVADYWANDLGTARGLDHFQTVRIEFHTERQAGFEAFKKGEVTWRQEFTAKVWATEYNFPAFEEGKVVKRLFPDELRPSMQASAFNTRRPQFRDRRVRDAIALCFDFEWTKRQAVPRLLRQESLAVFPARPTRRPESRASKKGR